MVFILFMIGKYSIAIYVLGLSLSFHLLMNYLLSSTCWLLCVVLRCEHCHVCIFSNYRFFQMRKVQGGCCRSYGDIFSIVRTLVSGTNNYIIASFLLYNFILKVMDILISETSGKIITSNSYFKGLLAKVMESEFCNVKNQKRRQ